MKPSSSLVFFLFFSFSLFAQKEANVWYFGNQCGLDFNSSVPVSLTDGVTNAWGGASACISDSTGKLLFYTDGEHVWNRNHSIMSNGSGLAGRNNITQPAIIIPNPENKNIYYLFTLSGATSEPGGNLYYSIIDMTRAGGLGQVTAKNVFLADSMTEKLTATQHGNGKDYWVVTHLWKSDAFYSYAVTKDGVNLVPVVSHSGSIHQGGRTDCVVTTRCNATGCMKLSSDGTKLALVIRSGIINSVLNTKHYAELFSFNNQTGIISDPIHLLSFPITGTSALDDKNTEAVEFSPDVTKLYFSVNYPGIIDSATIYQYDIKACTPEQITNSAYVINIEDEGDTYFQNGPDGKLYLTSSHGRLCVINRPNLSGPLCDYQDDTIILNGGTRNLPNFITSFFHEPRASAWTYTPTCLGDTTYFALVDTFRVKKAVWKFYYPAIGTYTYTESEELFPKYYYQTPGVFHVGVHIEYDYKCSRGRSSNVRIDSMPEFFFKDTTLCQEDTLHLNVFNAGATYLWHDGLTLPSRDIINPDTLSIEIKRGACVNKDTIIVNFKPLPVFDLGNDTTLCEGDVLTLNVFQPNYTYLWKDGSVQPDYTITDRDTIWVEVTLNDCKSHDSIIANYIASPSVSLGEDTVLCEGQIMDLQVHSDSFAYLWHDGSSLANIQIVAPDTVWVKAINKCGEDEDTIVVRFIAPPSVSLGNDTVLCYHDSLLISLPENYAYTWNDSDQGNKYIVTSSGVYTVEAKNKCGTTISTKRVENISCCDPSVPNLLTGNKDGLNEILTISCIEDGGWKLEIFNRWGENIFKAEDYQNNFDAGVLEGGVYFYNLSKSGRGLYNGWIHVVK